MVAESSLRNFVKYLVLQRSDLACLQILLYQIVSRGMVLRFRKQFAEVTGHTGPRVLRSGGGGQVFSQELRKEFGHYGGLHGVEATVQVYSVHSDRLLFFVRPSTVRSRGRTFNSSYSVN